MFKFTKGLKNGLKSLGPMILLLGGVAWSGCSDDSGSGNLGIELHWAKKTLPSIRAGGGFSPQAVPEGIDTIRVVVRGDFQEIAKDFPANEHQDGARIEEVPVGSGIEVRVEAREDWSGRVIYSGLAQGIEVKPGEVEEVDMLMTREGEFDLLPGMNTNRAFGCFSILNGGQVLISGGAESLAPGGEGWTITPTGSLEWFSPAEGLFQNMGTSLDAPRLFHTATGLGDDTLIFAGGMGEGWLHPDLSFEAERVIDSIEFYRPETGLVSTFGELNRGRFLHTANLLADGRVLLAGGWGENGERIATAEILDPGSGEIEEINMLASRAGHQAVVLPSGSILFWGGNEEGPVAEVYSPENGFQSFAVEDDFPLLEYHTLDLLDDWVLVSGGVVRQPYLVLANAWLISLSRDLADQDVLPRWSRAFHNSFQLGSGEVCLAGGVANISELSSRDEIECFNLQGRSFQPLLNTNQTVKLNTARFGSLGGSLLNGRVLICGGVTGNRDSLEVSASVEIYNPPGW